jgi:hypothetical protein
VIVGVPVDGDVGCPVGTEYPAPAGLKQLGEYLRGALCVHNEE